MYSNVDRTPETAFEEKKYKIEADLREDIFVKCNPESIKRIIMNLLTNAEDAMMPLGGQIDITLEKEAEYAKIEVQDYGKGMKKEVVEKIFNPFYTTKSSGTGLGMYIVYQLIEECGGKIEAYSKENEGTLIRVYLPLA